MTQKPIQIAVVTNQPERAEMVDRAATPLGWEVSANSGHMQPLSWLFGQVSDAVIIDLDLPHAEQLVAELSRTKPEQATLVMATTERLVDLQRVMLAGAKDFIALPINPEHFTTVIERSVNLQAPSAIAHRFESNGNADLRDTVPNGTVPNNTVPNDTVPNGTVPNDSSQLESEQRASVPFPGAQSGYADSDTASSMPYMPNVSQPEVVQMVGMPQPEIQAPVAQSVNIVSPTVEQANPSQPGMVQPETPQPNLYQPNMVPLEAPLPDTQPQSVQPQSVQPQSIEHPGAYASEAMAGNPPVHSIVPSGGFSQPTGYPPGGGMQPQSNDIPPSAPAPLTKRMIAVVGLRGGVGRSTIAVNLAMALQQRDFGGVSLLEAHHGLSHVSLMLHLHPRNTLAGLAEAPSLDIDIVRGHLQSHSSGINVLAAPSDLDELVELSGNQWATILDTVGQISPMMVVDTGGATDAALLETLVQATDILVVMTPEIASLRSTTALVNSLYTEAEVDGTVHIVLNRGGVGGGLDEGTIRKQLGHELAATLPDDSSLATYAMNRGIPFVNSHARSLLTKRMLNLATTIVGGSSEPAEAKKSGRSLLPFLNSLR